ncbi:MAG: DsbA family protein, partial [Brevundimonas sp.]
KTREQIEACLAEPSTIADLRASVDGGRAAGVAGTPTFFVNGQKVADGSMETLAAAVESAIR